MVILKILVAIMILFFPLGELGRVNIYNEVWVTINDILVGLTVLAWLAWLVFRGKFSDISKKDLSKPIFLFITIAFISLIFNYKDLALQEFIVSFLYLLRFAAYISIYFVVAGFDLNFKRKIFTFLIISGSLVVLIGFLQYFLYPNLRNLYYLGWDEHLYRLFSSFLDPNFAASVISLFLILLISILFLGIGKRKNTNLFLVFLSIISFIALLLTYSRSGYLMFFVSIIVLLFILGRKRFILILFLALVVGIALIPKDLGGEGVKLLRTASLISRTDYAKNAIVIFIDNPVLGVGFNAYRYAQYRYGFIDDSNLKTSHAGAGTDNSFLFVLATTGVVGFVGYLFLWFKVLKTSSDTFRISAGNSFGRVISCVIIASSVGIFINAFFINSLFYPFVMAWMWIVIGLKDNK
jgi:putative inorganic carbon (hco3(-)) transporter